MNLYLFPQQRRPLFDEEDKTLLNFLKPTVGAGPAMLKPYTDYHHKYAGNVFKKIIDFVNEGKTVILDLGNTNPRDNDLLFRKAMP